MPHPGMTGTIIEANAPEFQIVIAPPRFPSIMWLVEDGVGIDLTLPPEPL